MRISVKRSRTWRFLIRLAAFAAAVVLAVDVLPWPWGPRVLPSLSPYVTIGSAVALRTVHAAALVGLPALLIVLVRRRWFCRYVCPVGMMTECAGRLRPSGKTSTVDCWVAAEGEASSEPATVGPEDVARRPRARPGLVRRMPSLGPWIALVTLGGACFGYPLLLWLDPLAIFHGAFSAGRDPAGAAGAVSAAVLAAIVLTSVVLPGAWCLRICPLGATQDLLALPRRALMRIAGRGGTSRAEPTAPKKQGLARRSVLAAGLGAVMLGLGMRWGRAAKAGARAALLRPPGSADEGRFAGLCIRCGNCLRACPSGIIEPDSRSETIAGLLAPMVRFGDDYCREDCCRCTEVCPSGAIAPVALEEKRSAPIGLAVLDPTICVLADDKECDKCARICPYQAIEIVWSEEEYIALPKIDAARCPGCGACEMVCPGTNDWEREHSDAPVPLRRAIEVHPRRSSEA